MTQSPEKLLYQHKQYN